MNRLDIVIPSAGRPDDLLRLLASLRDHCSASLQAMAATITVSDDRHSDAIGRRVAELHPEVRYLKGPARGPAANRNWGAAAGRGEWVLFLDDDCYVERDVLAVLDQALGEDKTLGFIEGAIGPEGPRPSPNHHAPINLRGGQLWACNVAVQRSVFDGMGGFDERFPFAAMEDCELHERLRAAQIHGRFLPQMAVVHPWRSVSERELWKQFVSHAIMAEKHPHFRARWSVVNLLRMGLGRLRNLGEGRLRAITWGKARTVVLLTVLPLGLFMAVRWPWLRRSLTRRHANPVATPASLHAASRTPSLP